MMYNERHDAEKLGSCPICDGIAKLLKTRPSLKRRHTVDERAEISEPFRKDWHGLFFLQITVRETSIMYNERKVFIMLPEIFYQIAAIAFIGTIAVFPFYIAYCAYKAFKMTKDLTSTDKH